MPRTLCTRERFLGTMDLAWELVIEPMTFIDRTMAVSRRGDDF